MTWRPILADDGGIVEAIAAEIENVESDDPTLANGHAGLALFYAYLWRTRGEERHGDVAVAYLDRAIDGLAAGGLGLGLFTGITGIAWVAHHLAGPDFTDDDTDVTADLDDALLEALRPPWTGEYDLISGLTGLGVYALDHPIEDRRHALLERILTHLEALAVEDEHGVSWFTPPSQIPASQRTRFPAGYTNVGLAHGVPGTIAMLARAAAVEGIGEGAQHLLDRAMAWLLAQRLDDTFPAFISQDEVVPNSRSAWCYGDPGIATALWAAGYPEAKSIAHQDSARPMTDAGVVDGGLCHGATSLAHLANRWHQASGDDHFADTARRWLDALQDLRHPTEGIGGFTAVSPANPKDPRPGYLTGAAGIALTLLAATSAIEPSWDTPLLATLPVV